MSSKNRLLYTLFLVSVALTSVQSRGLGREVGSVAIGLVQFDTVRVHPGRETGEPHIVVRVWKKGTKFWNFGFSNEVGALVMPLQPGDYCFDAFSREGKRLKMHPPAAERCFSVKKDDTVLVGVEID
jgi:hypothetical protein